jgi:DNA-binding transcriptional ArsR family regulator
VTYEAVIVALADPTRRAMFQRLRRRPHTVGELAANVGVSQPAVSQHLSVLRDARLVVHEAHGTSRHYRANREGLEELRAWLESMWDEVLAAYAADDPAPPRRRKAR